MSFRCPFLRISVYLLLKLHIISVFAPPLGMPVRKTRGVRTIVNSGNLNIENYDPILTFDPKANYRREN